MRSRWCSKSIYDNESAIGRKRRFPQIKTLEDFDLSYQRSIRKEIVAHFGALDFVEDRDNVIFLGPPGTGKTHLAVAFRVRACQVGHGVAFATAAQWVDHLGAAHGHVSRPPGVRRKSSDVNDG